MRRTVYAPSLVAFVAFVAFAASGTGAAAAPRGTTDWPDRKGGPAALQYSPLAQIDRRNVHRLAPAWTFDAGDAFPGSELQCTPTVVDGVLYATTARLNVVALDAATGRVRWRFDPGTVDRPIVGKSRSRGVTYWSSGREARIYFGFRHFLFALDARTGRPVPSFGEAGRIDLRSGLDRDPTTASVALTSPAVAYDNLLIVGSAVPETLPSTPGDVRAYDARSGALVWRFRTVPAPGEPGVETWPAGARAAVGGANAWSGVSVDARAGVVYVPTGSPAGDFYGGNRPGDNLYANTLLALDARTGRRLWHRQIVRHDLWDRDLPAPPALFEWRAGGRSVPALAQVTKSGHVFVLDRRSGTPLFPLVEREVPASDIPGETAAPRQTLPSLPAPFARQLLDAATVTDRTPAARAAVLERLRTLRNGAPFTPGSVEGTVLFPGFDGGAEWGGPAIDPRRGVLYVNANDVPWVLRLVKAEPNATSARGLYLQHCAACHRDDLSGTPPEFPDLRGVGARYGEVELLSLLMSGGARMPAFAGLGLDALLRIREYLVTGRDAVRATTEPSSAHSTDDYRFAGYDRLTDPDGYPGSKPPWGTLTAIDLASGRQRWQIPLGEYPELAAAGVPATGTENYGGPVVTAGGVLFIGATAYDATFRAFDADTGALLWKAPLPAGGHATPAVYAVAGREYVVIAAGGGKGRGASAATYVAYALPRDAAR